MRCRVSPRVCSCTPASAQETHKNWEPGDHPNSKHVPPPLPPPPLPPMTGIAGAGKVAHPITPTRAGAELPCCLAHSPSPWPQACCGFPVCPACASLVPAASPVNPSVFQLGSTPDPPQQAGACGALLAQVCGWVGDPCTKGDGAQHWLGPAVVLGRGQTLLGATLVPGKASGAVVGGDV